MAPLEINLDGFENPFEIHGGKISIPFLSTQLVPCKLGDYTVPIECHVHVSGKKRLVKTPVPGRDGTVKELTGRDDYTIKIDLVLMARNYSAVSAEVAQVIAEWDKKESITIVCPKTDMYGIEKVVFEDIDHPETPGMQGYETLTLTFVSDDELELMDDTSLLEAMDDLI
ncbi:MAG: hypothetical protein JXK07_09970 [Spirochaetes bacterium]|nr:hypothetical protein [Spirochaetota bacterium]MBN2771276.1 hypothetical protein [Spirochaetota bacterium]